MSGIVYPAIAISPCGFVELVESEDHWRRFPVAFRSIYLPQRKPVTLYDSSSTQWAFKDIEFLDRLRFYERLLGLGLRLTSVRPICESLGEYQLMDLVETMRSAVDADDDVLTQFHEAEDILGKLSVCVSVPEVIETIKWMQTDEDWDEDVPDCLHQITELTGSISHSQQMAPSEPSPLEILQPGHGTYNRPVPRRPSTSSRYSSTCAAMRSA